MNGQVCVLPLFPNQNRNFPAFETMYNNMAKTLVRFDPGTYKIRVELLLQDRSDIFRAGKVTSGEFNLSFNAEEKADFLKRDPSEVGKEKVINPISFPGEAAIADLGLDGNAEICFHSQLLKRTHYFIGNE